MKETTNLDKSVNMSYLFNTLLLKFRQSVLFNSKLELAYNLVFVHFQFIKLMIKILLNETQAREVEWASQAVLLSLC